MLFALQVATLVAVAVAMALPLAHALELPGKRRLPKEHYLAMQPVYYPGFTFGGIAEPLALLALLSLLFVMPSGSTAFALTLAAFAVLLTMHATYWLLTHPVNDFWLRDTELKGAGAGFFALDPFRRRGEDGMTDWQQLRNRWELSHVVRAVLGVISLALFAAALAA